MQASDIVSKIIQALQVDPYVYLRKPRAGHPGWTNEYFIGLIVKYGTGPNIVKAECCGEQTFNRACKILLTPILGSLHGGGETYKNKLFNLIKVKICPRCKNILEYSYYNIDNSQPYGITSCCKICESSKNKAYYSNNKDIYHKPYIEAHRSEYNARNANRRAVRVASTPSWANLGIIKDIFEYCPEGCHVDHKVPLQGAMVCGLHVENNLQYLTAEENLYKSNKLLEEFSNSNWT